MTLKTMYIEYDPETLPKEYYEFTYGNTHVVSTPKTVTAWIICFYRKWHILPISRSYWSGEYEDEEYIKSVLDLEKELWKKVIIDGETD